MKNNSLKILLILVIIVPLFALMVFSTSPFKSLGNSQDVATTYKSQCAACHNPKAEKFFDLNLSDEVLTEIILKGKKGEKPPYMPGYEAKGMKVEQAKELVVYMKKLRSSGNTNSNNSNVNSNRYTAENVNTNNAVNVNTNNVVNVNTNNTVNTNSNTVSNTNELSSTNSNKTSNVHSNMMPLFTESEIEEAKATFKSKCLACHGAKSEKFFDITKTDNVLTEIILKGKKGAKPPFMPGYEANGINTKKAQTLVFLMRQLRSGGK